MTLNHNKEIKLDDSSISAEEVLYICCRLVDSFIEDGCYDDKRFDFISACDYNEIKEFIMEDNL